MLGDLQQRCADPGAYDRDGDKPQGSGPAASSSTPKVKIVVGHGATPKTGKLGQA